MPSEDQSAGSGAVRVGVVIPVHNEEHQLLAALQAVDRAMRGISTQCRESRLVVVLDDCVDRSAAVVDSWRNEATTGAVEVIAVRARNVGLARRTGCAALLEHWSTTAADDIWLATTDADSEVPANWLAAQVRARDAGAHVWVGPVEVGCWDERASGTADEWCRRYALEQLPVHGANFGVDAAMYLRTGGFEDRVTGEDRDLLNRLLVHGAVARAEPSVRVVTSGRRHARAPHGFAQALLAIEQSLPVTAVAS